MALCLNDNHLELHKILNNNNISKIVLYSYSTLSNNLFFYLEQNVNHYITIITNLNLHLNQYMNSYSYFF